MKIENTKLSNMSWLNWISQKYKMQKIYSYCGLMTKQKKAE